MALGEACGTGCPSGSVEGSGSGSDDGPVASEAVVAPPEDAPSPAGPLERFSQLR